MKKPNREAAYTSKLKLYDSEEEEDYESSSSEGVVNQCIYALIILQVIFFWVKIWNRNWIFVVGVYIGGWDRARTSRRYIRGASEGQIRWIAFGFPETERREKGQAG